MPHFSIKITEREMDATPDWVIDSDPDGTDDGADYDGSDDDGTDDL